MTYWVGSSLPSQQVMKSIALNFDTDKLGFCITTRKTAKQTLIRHLTLLPHAPFASCLRQDDALCHTPASHRA